MPKSEALLEVISVKLSRFSLDQLEEVAVSVKCIEAGEEASGTKVACLMKELESARASLDYHKSECNRLELTLSDCLVAAQKSKKLEKKVKDLRNELRSSTRKWNVALEQKEELEFAVSNLQETILRMSKREVA